MEEALISAVYTGFRRDAGAHHCKVYEDIVFAAALITEKLVYLKKKVHEALSHTNWWRENALL